MASTSAATCTGRCSTTSSGWPATRRPSGWLPSTSPPSSAPSNPRPAGWDRWRRGTSSRSERLASGPVVQHHGAVTAQQLQPLDDLTVEPVAPPPSSARSTSADRSAPRATRCSSPARGSSGGGSRPPATSVPLTAATQMATTVANRSVGRPARSAHPTTGRIRCGNFLEPSAPTWRQVWPRPGFAKRRSVSGANASASVAGGRSATASTSPTSACTNGATRPSVAASAMVVHPTSRPA